MRGQAHQEAMMALLLAAQGSLLLSISATCNIVFLLLAPWSLVSLYGSPVKVRLSWQCRWKFVAGTIYSACQLVPLLSTVAVIRSQESPSPRLTYIETASGFLGALALLWVSSLAHWRSIEPSRIIVACLLAKSACYTVLATLPGEVHDRPLEIVRGCSIIPLLFLELQGKRRILLAAYQSEPPEATTSFVGRVFFTWINPILFYGYRRILHGEDLPPLDRALESRSLRQAVLRAWDQRGKPEGAATLPRVLLDCILMPFLTAIIPRTAVIVFRFAQPVLMSQAIRFVNSVSAANNLGSAAYFLVVEATAVYVGMAVSTSVYEHRVNRLKVMIRGAMVSLIHSRALDSRNSETEDGKVATLVSNDISNIEDSARMFHETWAQFVEVVIGTFLLSQQVGWLWPVPLVLIIFCSRVSRYVAQHLKPEQARWNIAVQQRMSFTNSALGSIKNIRMLGIQEAVMEQIQKLRRNEIDAARGARLLTVQYGASANALGLFAPVFTIVLYAALAALRGDGMDAETTFTTVALLLMITHPANMIMTFVPRAVIAYSGFDRIQTYLLNSHNPAQPGETIKMPVIGPVGTSPLAVELAGVSIPGTDGSRDTLRDISFRIYQGSLVIFTGPVGSGKTTLARAILGEIPTSRGIITVSPERVAYCSQFPWLPSEVIRDVICGPVTPHGRDETWYQKTIEACCLDTDFKALPDGDLTHVGSKGMNLSGGQRQRIALARAIYSRCKIMILDDCFSALDEKTQSRVAESLLRPGGIVHDRTKTIIWITTSATKFWNLADEIIVLANGVLKERERGINFKSTILLLTRSSIPSLKWQ